MSQSSDRMKREALALDRLFRAEASAMLSGDTESSVEVSAMLELERWRLGFPCDTVVGQTITQRIVNK